jgi:Secretion system C-terminal sorting domain
MKRLLACLFFITCFAYIAYGQKYHVDSTRFITGNTPGTNIDYAIPTIDKGILFVGSEGGTPGGIIPPFPLDSTFLNVLIGKIDSNQKIEWIKVYGGSKEDGAGAVCETSDGGYIVLASVGSNDGDITGYRGNGDIWLLRIDGAGNMLWQKTYGSTQSDGLMSIANTPDGGFIILSTTNGNDGDAPFHYGGFFSFDWLVIKTDALGNVQWSKDIGGTGDEQSVGTILSVGDDYYIASGTDSRDYDCTDTAWHAGVNTGDDAYLLKLDNTGNVLWSKSYGGGNTDVFYNALYDDRDNTIVMTGSGYSSGYMCADQHGEGDMFTVKTDLDGNIIWHHSFGHKSEETGKCIIKDKGTGYLLYGSIFPSPDTTFGYIGGVDNELISVDKGGNELAYKIFGGKAAELPTSLVPYLNTYVAVGCSKSATFTEGTCNNNQKSAFISYLGEWALSASNSNVTASATISIYPNPSHRSVTISIPGSGGKGNITITGSNGSAVWEKRTRPGDIDVNVETWPNGTYTVNWHGKEGGTSTAKFIKM